MISVSHGLIISWPWTDAILAGKKVIETREYSLPTDLLDTSIGLIEIGNPAVPGRNLVGVCTFVQSKKYVSKRDWLADSAMHLVPPNDPHFGWKMDTEKWGWVVTKISLQRVKMSSCPASTKIVKRSILRFHNPVLLEQSKTGIIVDIDANHTKCKL